MKMTNAHLHRTASMLQGFANGEPVTLEDMKGVLYVFGSELACLRIFAHYQSNGAIHNPYVRTGYSPTHQSCYCAIERRFASTGE